MDGKTGIQAQVSGQQSSCQKLTLSPSHHAVSPSLALGHLCRQGLQGVQGVRDGWRHGGLGVWGLCCLLLYDCNNISKSPTKSQGHCRDLMLLVSLLSSANWDVNLLLHSLPSWTPGIAGLSTETADLPLRLLTSLHHEAIKQGCVSAHSLSPHFPLFLLSALVPLPSAFFLFSLPIPSLSPALGLLHAFRRKGQLILLPPPPLSCTLVRKHRPPDQGCLSTAWKPGLIGKRSHSFFHCLKVPKEVLPSQAKVSTLRHQSSGRSLGLPVTQRITFRPAVSTLTCGLGRWVSITAPSHVHTLRHHEERRAWEQLINVLQGDFIYVVLHKYLTWRSFLLRE